MTEKKILPATEKQHFWEVYSKQLQTEYRQSLEEGLDVEKYKPVFDAVSSMPDGEYKDKMADVIFDIVRSAPQREDFKYSEPSELEEIKKLLPGKRPNVPVFTGDLKEKLAGAWYGRICGCLLGKTVEGIHTDELHYLLKSSDNFPMHRYILSTDVTEEMKNTFKFGIARRCFADKVSAMPVDDDTNYTVLYQILIEKYGRDFTPYDVSRLWLSHQPKDAYCTAERVAFRNFVAGYIPPDSANYKNPYREWIGAQIRGDYFGYINPCRPDLAAEMAWRDACIAQTKNGIYGEMFVAAAIACAASEKNIENVIWGGLAQIPETSRFYERVSDVIRKYKSGVSQDEFFADLHKRYNEFDGHDWCLTISNAEIVAAVLLYGGDDYGKTICLAVQQGFDTDCNAATAGSILGMKNGRSSIGDEWTAPICGKLDTSIFGVGTVSIDSLVEKTMKHIEK